MTAIDGPSAQGRLPTGERLFIGDGGLETTLIFGEGIELPCFAAYPLLRDETGREALRRYYRGYLEIARRHATGFTLDTPTWRANADWGGGGWATTRRRSTRRTGTRWRWPRRSGPRRRARSCRSRSAARSGRAATATSRAS